MEAYDSVRREVLYNILVGFGKANKSVSEWNLYQSQRLSDMFPTKNDLKQGDALTPLLFNVALEYAIRRAQVNQMTWK